MIDSENNKQWLRERLSKMTWVNLALIPPSLSRFQSLLDEHTPFAIMVTESKSLTKEYSIMQTSHIIEQARQLGLICVPLNLSYRPRDEQALASDLALMIYTKSRDPTMAPPAEHQILRPFVIDTLNKLDLKVALYANSKRCGCFDRAGRWQNSFRTASLTPEKLRSYLSWLIFEYLLLEVGASTGGILVGIGSPVSAVMFVCI